MVSNLTSAVNGLATLKFKSEKSRLTAFQVLGPSVVYIGIQLVSRVVFKEEWVGWGFTVFMMLTQIAALWMWVDTGYEISETHLHYHCGSIKGKIEIAAIRKIEQKKTYFGQMQPALGNNGLKVYYHKYEEIILTPEDQVAFVQELRSRNPNIQVR